MGAKKNSNSLFVTKRKTNSMQRIGKKVFQNRFRNFLEAENVQNEICAIQNVIQRRD
jgi:hypothetical protein